MASAERVSVIIPTFNRLELVQRAIDCALAQTRPVDEIVVIDDGSTDGTGEALRQRYGDRIVYQWQPNAGVSAARNAGMRLASGELFALLDSDDLWDADKTRLQVDWLRAHPDFGMVLCDVSAVDSGDGEVEILRRRDTIRSDGMVLHDVLGNPSLVPASAMLRREVFEDIGGFDTSLRTAEDLDFHLRVARRWKIGVIEQVLVEAMRGHAGLSLERNTYDDYIHVMERLLADMGEELPPAVRRHARFNAYRRNAYGTILQRRWATAWRFARIAWRNAENRGQRRELLALLPLAGKRALLSMSGRYAEQH